MDVAPGDGVDRKTLHALRTTRLVSEDRIARRYRDVDPWLRVATREVVQSDNDEGGHDDRGHEREHQRKPVSGRPRSRRASVNSIDFATPHVNNDHTRHAGRCVT